MLLPGRSLNIRTAVIFLLKGLEHGKKHEHDHVLYPVMIRVTVGIQPSSLGVILAAADHQSAEIRAEVLGSLRFYLEGPEASRIVATKFEDQSEKVVLEALRAANWLNRHISAKRITPLLKHPNARIREMACYALDGCQDPDAVGPLLDATEDQDPHVRGHAAVTLGRIGAAGVLMAE